MIDPSTSRELTAQVARASLLAERVHLDERGEWPRTAVLVVLPEPGDVPGLVEIPDVALGGPASCAARSATRRVVRPLLSVK